VTVKTGLSNQNANLSIGHRLLKGRFFVNSVDVSER
jgi:hypothetical protein